MITVSPHAGVETVIHGAYLIESVREVKRRQASHQIRWALKTFRSTVEEFRACPDTATVWEMKWYPRKKKTR